MTTVYIVLYGDWEQSIAGVFDNKKEADILFNQLKTEGKVVDIEEWKINTSLFH